MSDMCKEQAVALTGGLSCSDKAGCGYSLPTERCRTGSRLRRKQHTVCSKCYCHNRNRYRFPNVRNALEKRYELIGGPQWAAAMVHLIGDRKTFRWFDSGDLPSLGVLEDIMEIARRTPGTRHWLPTKEWHGHEKDVKPKIVDRYLAAGGVVPSNVCLRYSMYYIDQDPLPEDKGNYAAVATNPKRVTCPATLLGGSCESNKCSKCWNRRVRLVRYLLH